MLIFTGSMCWDGAFPLLQGCDDNHLYKNTRQIVLFTFGNYTRVGDYRSLPCWYGFWVGSRTKRVWNKEWLKMKMTKLWIGYFMTISCHFFTNYINNFRKTEDLRVILVCPIYKNINWIKSYDINNNFCFVSVFSIL